MNTQKEEWVVCSEKMPEVDGKYKCFIKNGDREFEAVRVLKKGHWFGGCRPFTDNDIILKWRNI